MHGEPCILVNRTSRPLSVQQNGVIKILQPGDNMLSADWIRFAKLQHPRRGTFDPSGMDGDYLIGVKGVDDCSPIKPGEEHHGPDRFDRSRMDGEASQAVAVPTGIQDPMRRVPSEMGGGLPNDAVFTRE